MSAQPTEIKAVAYVVNKDEFVVFTYTNFFEAGVQLLIGTVEESKQTSRAIPQNKK
ncbi:hypothetical protein [Nostoc sp. FACHB-133]|uniref:hypothetical protein n=1 Tax=Nostoc sp. FACHB-133 TaxID=2692835 RepID=UPI001685CCC4|nr:hypothetical protein [Nostoc sp. FACHB-133]MBD2521919.1 hypothetical protein [Nostoc sp. FACHB-133]